MPGEKPESGEGPAPTGPPTTVQDPPTGTDGGAPRASGHVHAHHTTIQFRFLEQLKHRNIIRVGILYLVACWLILDPVHVVFHMLEVPAWANRLVVILLAIGFPVVLLFAWVYEITPEGLKPTVEVDPHRSIRKLTGFGIRDRTSRRQDAPRSSGSQLRACWPHFFQFAAPRNLADPGVLGVAAIGRAF
jgi:hypothetical protein